MIDLWRIQYYLTRTKTVRTNYNNTNGKQWEAKIKLGIMKSIKEIPVESQVRREN